MAHHATGVDLDGHPMRHLRERLGGLGVLTAAELRGSTLRHGARVSVAGLVVVRQRPGTAKGFVFLGLEDETGRIDVIITPALYAEERAIINGSGILAVRGRLGKEDGVTNLRAETFFPLSLETAGQVIRSHDYH
jgi:error-prone DNA polymerase